MFTREERNLILKVRKWAENQSYETRRAYFYDLLRRIGSRPDYKDIRFAYSIAQNLVLDESDLIDIMCSVWGLSEDDIYGCVI